MEAAPGGEMDAQVRTVLVVSEALDQADVFFEREVFDVKNERPSVGIRFFHSWRVKQPDESHDLLLESLRETRVDDGVYLNTFLKVFVVGGGGEINRVATLVFDDGETGIGGGSAGDAVHGQLETRGWWRVGGESVAYFESAGRLSDLRGVQDSFMFFDNGAEAVCKEREGGRCGFEAKLKTWGFERARRGGLQPAEGF